MQYLGRLLSYNKVKHQFGKFGCEMLQNKAIEIKYLRDTLIDIFNQKWVHKNDWKMVFNMNRKSLPKFGHEKVANLPELLQN